ncbi:MAG: NUDIX domain-containing protein [Ilumatobacteraceae bacterium]
MKGVVIVEDRVILLQNERNEWELPGGKPMSGETPEDTVAREIFEELNIPVIVGGVVDAWMYEICAGITVLVITYRCSPMSTTRVSDLHLSTEHSQLGVFSALDLPELRLPLGYLRSIARATGWSIDRQVGREPSELAGEDRAR